MALNRLFDKPIYMDKFDGDVTVHAGPITVIRIDFLSSDGDVFVLEDIDGNHIIQIMQTTTGRIKSWDPGEPVRFNKGLYFDTGDVSSGLNNDTDKVWIYYK